MLTSIIVRRGPFKGKGGQKPGQKRDASPERSSSPQKKKGRDDK
jgi:hypothetical protein